MKEFLFFKLGVGTCLSRSVEGRNATSSGLQHAMRMCHVIVSLSPEKMGFLLKTKQIFSGLSKKYALTQWLGSRKRERQSDLNPRKIN